MRLAPVSADAVALRALAGALGIEGRPFSWTQSPWRAPLGARGVELAITAPWPRHDAPNVARGPYAVPQATLAGRSADAPRAEWSLHGPCDR
jgi:hypothetical protein